VAKNQHFHPYRKNYALDRKIIHTFYNCHDVLYQHAKIWEIELHAPAVGAKIVVFFLYVTLGLPARGGQFKQVLSDGLWVNFDEIFSDFSKWIVVSDTVRSSHFRC